ncbi:MAG: Smr/MutS family protein [Trichlorobacter sp.]|nr:Smr/MutS family protein [Trichlorobacter sp.]
MSRKKKQNQQTAKPAEFRTASFAQLKSLTFDTQPEPEPVRIKPVLQQRKATQDTDAEIFIQAMEGVTPLNAAASLKKQPDIKSDDSENIYRKPAITDLPVENNTDFLKEIERLQLDVRFEDELPEAEELKPLGGNRLRMLKRGIIRVDRQLDLHGLTRDEATQALESFLRSARNASEKAVLVITGKGLHSAGEPVLGQAVTAWLREQGRTHILEFTPAPKEFGGSGALIVFLRSLDKTDTQ